MERTTRRLTIALVLFAAACAPETPPPAPPAPEAAAPGVAVTFMAPSGNIGCIYIPAGGTDVYQPSAPGAELQCDRVEPTYLRVVLPEHAAARVVDTQERGCCGGETIEYGQTWAEGPYTCDVTDAGVACASAVGHGFTLSRAAVETR